MSTEVPLDLSSYCNTVSVVMVRPHDQIRWVQQHGQHWSPRIPQDHPWQEGSGELLICRGLRCVLQQRIKMSISIGQAQVVPLYFILFFVVVA
jgi:hypothetical protein